MFALRSREGSRAGGREEALQLHCTSQVSCG